jgi:2-polyprenyl-3-methyl-5-hydroxy-6-metoxy-1,4-benzoquinol methylase
MNAHLLALEQYWDQRYRNDTYLFGTEPNAYLVQQMQQHPRQGAALCLADGEGRNGVWLASQGLAVTSIDISSAAAEKALQLAQQKAVALNFVVADLNSFDYGQAHYAVIASIFLHLPEPLRRRVHQLCFEALQPGGVFVWEAFTPQQRELNTGGPKDPHLLFTLEAVLSDFPEGVVLHRYEGLTQLNEGPAHCGEAYISQCSIMKPLR